PLNREIDDIGYFDAIALARPYAALLDLAGLSPRFNSEYLDGSQMNERALAACGVKLVIASGVKAGHALPSGPRLFKATPVADPAPRAVFFPTGSLLPLDRAAIHERLRDPAFDLRRVLMG